MRSTWSWSRRSGQLVRVIGFASDCRRAVLELHELYAAESVSLPARQVANVVRCRGAGAFSSSLVLLIRRDWNRYPLVVSSCRAASSRARDPRAAGSRWAISSAVASSNRSTIAGWFLSASWTLASGATQRDSYSSPRPDEDRMEDACSRSKRRARRGCLRPRHARVPGFGSPYRVGVADGGGRSCGAADDPGCSRPLPKIATGVAEDFLAIT